MWNGAVGQVTVLLSEPWSPGAEASLGEEISGFSGILLLKDWSWNQLALALQSLLDMRALRPEQTS